MSKSLNQIRSLLEEAGTPVRVPGETVTEEKKTVGCAAATAPAASAEFKAKKKVVTKKNIKVAPVVILYAFRYVLPRAGPTAERGDIVNEVIRNWDAFAKALQREIIDGIKRQHRIMEEQQASGENPYTRHARGEWLRHAWPEWQKVLQHAEGTTS